MQVVVYRLEFELVAMPSVVCHVAPYKRYLPFPALGE